MIHLPTKLRSLERISGRYCSILIVFILKNIKLEEFFLNIKNIANAYTYKKKAPREGKM